MKPFVVLIGLIALSGISPATAQSAFPSPAAALLEANVASLERLALPFPEATDALRAAANGDYVLAERSEYVTDEEGFFQPASQTRVEFEDTRQTDGMRRRIETSYTWNGHEFIPEGRTRFVYSVAPPVLLRVEDEEWDPAANGGAGEFVLVAQRFNTFAGNQGSYLPASTTYQVRDGDEWVFVERILYTVGGVGLTAYYTEGETQVWSGSAWEPSRRFLIQEGSSLELAGVTDVLYTDQEWDGGAWQNVERTRYLGLTILELNNRLLDLMHDLEELGGVLYAIRFPDHVTQAWDGITWQTVGRQSTGYTYEFGTGVVLHAEVTAEVFEDGIWLPESRMVRAYEPFQSSSRVVLTDLEMFDRDGWVLFMRESNDHDATSGKLGTVTWEMGYEEEFFPVLRIEYEWVPAAGTSTEPPPAAGRYMLDAPFPNPTAAGASLTYHLDASGTVAVRVYDALGRRVATLFEGEQVAGVHPLSLDTDALRSGLYFVRLEAPGIQHTRPLTIVR